MDSKQKLIERLRELVARLRAAEQRSLEKAEQETSVHGEWAFRGRAVGYEFAADWLEEELY